MGLNWSITCLFVVFAASCHFLLFFWLILQSDIFAAVQKKGYVDLQEMAKEDSLSCNYGFTLPKDPACNLLCSWTAADPSTFLIRGETYLEDRKKVSVNIIMLTSIFYSTLDCCPFDFKFP